MIDLKKIDEAIEHFNKVCSNLKETVVAHDPEKTALSVLQHVKSHGLALKEEEIEKIITDWDFKTFSGLKTSKILSLAEALTERQRGI